MLPPAPAVVGHFPTARALTVGCHTLPSNGLTVTEGSNPKNIPHRGQIRLNVTKRVKTVNLATVLDDLW